MVGKDKVAMALSSELKGAVDPDMVDYLADVVLESVCQSLSIFPISIIINPKSVASIVIQYIAKHTSLKD